MTQKTLNDLKIGESGQITSIQAKNQDELHRLLEQGLTSGTMVKVIAKPWEGNMVILVRDFELALGRDIPNRIKVEIIVAEAEEKTAVFHGKIEFE